MLYLNPNQEKILTFDVELSGASLDEVNGFVRFFIDEDVQLGFPVLVTRDQIRTVIAPLKNLIKKPIKSGTIFEAQLDLYTTNEDYFRAWKGEIEIHTPSIRIEAKLTEEDDRPSPKRFAAKQKAISESRNDKKITSKAEPVSEKRVVRKTKTEGKSDKRWDKRRLQNITEEDIIKYMERAGTKNRTIQQIVLNEAAAAAVEKGYKGNVGILREVVHTLKKPKK